MKNDKCPGPDGFNCGLVELFFGRILEFLLQEQSVNQISNYNSRVQTNKASKHVQQTQGIETICKELASYQSIKYFFIPL